MRFTSMPDPKEIGQVGLPVDADERARLLDEADLTPAERQAVEMFVAIKNCPHSAKQIDHKNPCPCGIRWRYDERIEGYRRAH